MSDSLKVEAGSDKVSIEVSGNAAGRLAQQLADLLSPMTEGMGLIGDKIRIFRQKAVIEALEKAHRIAKERGHKLGPVPPKFLVQWLEGASVEDDTEGLQTLWAKLLVSASKSHENGRIAYLEFLKKIGPEDAKVLSFFAEDTSPEFGDNFYMIQAGERFIQHVPDQMRKWINEKKKPTNGELLLRLEGLALGSNRQLLYIAREGSLILPTEYFRKNEKSVAMLEHEGAVKIHIRDISSKGIPNMQLCWMEITKFAFDFYWACEGFERKLEIRT